ncbi:cytochrome P450 [Moorena bouillonii]|uniref:Cytochrome n=1 Tax=Moorena bouillonii PNG TaxID=568701 RepID=A0A1U7N7A4_9CYAN|nr:cytochrome P450 [Moorena bouillonii]OLT61805.1 cytochrome [Moorena bouillonii PNG]
MNRASGNRTFEGDIRPSRVPLFRFGRPSLPFPHFLNYREPIRILDTFFWRTDALAGSARHNRYLDVPGFPLVLVTREPAVIRSVLSDTGDKDGQFDRDTSPSAGIARATGEDSLLYANGPLWRQQKKLAAPSFSHSSLFQPEKFHEFEQTFRKTVSDRLDLLRERQAETGEVVSRIALEPEISVVMLEMLINNFFGGNTRYEELRDRYVPSMLLLIDHMVRDTIAHRLRRPFHVLSGRAAKLRQARADFEELTDIALAGRSDGLGLWAQFKSDASDEKLRSNIRVFLAGALEATTSFASWALSHLARAPEIQDRIFEEVRGINVYDPDNLAQAATLGRVLEETLRLTPSLYFLPRRASVDTWVETKDGRRLRIPRGTHVVLDVWHANRCEDFWGEEVSGAPAEAFAPERWVELAARGYSPKDILHFGFGYGPRVCPGKFLGLLEVGLVVGAFVKIFRFTAPNHRLQPKAGVSTKPADGVLVDLQVRGHIL